jgi:glutamine amidotransferase
MIAIIDYHAGNLTSVQRALHKLGYDSEITRDPEKLGKSERIIFPGVGAAGKAMLHLRCLGLDQALREAYEEGKPILGICLGTQIIMERSDENDTVCLGLIGGRVQRFPEELRNSAARKLKVPHMGWNGIRFVKKHPLCEGVHPDSEFYFVHSYYPSPENEGDVVGETDYGIRFASVVGARNLFCRWAGGDDA